MDAAERPWSSVSGSDCLASVVIALVPRFRHRNRQLEHDRAVAEPLGGRSQPRCPRRTSVALARSSLSDPPTPSHHDLVPKHHFESLPRAPRSFQNSPRPATAQNRSGHPPRNTKRIRGPTKRAFAGSFLAAMHPLMLGDLSFVEARESIFLDWKVEPVVDSDRDKNLWA